MQKYYSYNYYYSNKPHTDVYFISAIAKNPDIITNLKNIQEKTNLFIRFAKSLRIFDTQFMALVTKKIQRQTTYTLEHIRQIITTVGADILIELPKIIDDSKLGYDISTIIIDFSKEIFACLSNLYQVPTLNIFSDNDRIINGRPTIKNITYVQKNKIYDEYQFVTQSIINRTQKMFYIFLLYLSDIYRKIYPVYKSKYDQIISDIENEIGKSKIFNLSWLRDAFNEYIKNNETMLEYFDTVMPDIFTKFTDNSNSTSIKFILVSANMYKQNHQIYDDADLLLSKISPYTSPNIIELYNSEINNYKNLTELDDKINETINQNKIQLDNEINQFDTLIQTISLVMFNSEYKKYPFVSNNKLRNSASETIKNIELIRALTIEKLYDIVNKNNSLILSLAQINNYQTFKIVIDKLIKSKPFVPKFYKRISFGLAEYYYDILDSVRICIMSKPFDQLLPIEKYLYEYHYIQIQRCYQLFKWLIKDYLPMKQAADMKNKVTTSIIRKKIDPFKTMNDINMVFLEFQGLRKYLDDYSAVVMDKVQLHLRINDFENKDANKKLIVDASNRGIQENQVDFMLDTDPYSNIYRKRWDMDPAQLVFSNKRGNVLQINFDLLEKIEKYKNPQSTKIFGELYNQTYQRWKNNQGIDFQNVFTIHSNFQIQILSANICRLAQILSTIKVPLL